jgi:hypothetical protein
MRSKSLGFSVLAVLAGVIVASAAAGGQTLQSASPAGLTVTPGTQPTLVSKEILRDGAAKLVFSDGSVYVGEPDAQITFSWPDGQTEEMSSALPTPTSPDDLLAQIASYQAHGRSVAEDMREAGFTPPGKIAGDGQPDSQRQVASVRHTGSTKRSKLNFGTANQVYQSACQTIDNGAIFWKGCIVRKGTASTDPNYYYLGDSTNGTGYGTGSTIAEGADHLNYPNADLIVDQNPSADYSVGAARLCRSA